MNVIVKSKQTLPKPYGRITFIARISRAKECALLKSKGQTTDNCFVGRNYLKING